METRAHNTLKAEHPSEFETRTHDPSLDEWANTLGDLAATKVSLGEITNDKELFVDAANDLRTALAALSHESRTAAWCRMQANLGTALLDLGEREAGYDHLVEAVAALRASRDAIDRRAAPLYWAASTNNLGNGLRILGERQLSIVEIDESVRDLADAAAFYERSPSPRQWATTETNLAATYEARAEVTGDQRDLEAGIMCCRAALLRENADQDPGPWRRTMENLGGLLGKLGEKRKDLGLLREAVQAASSAERRILRANADHIGVSDRLG